MIEKSDEQWRGDEEPTRPHQEFDVDFVLHADAWEQEIERRLREIDEGCAMVPREVVRQDLLAALDESDAG